MFRQRVCGLLALLLLVLAAIPSAPPLARAAQEPPAPAQAEPVVLEPVAESEPNNRVSANPADDRSDPIGPEDQQLVKDWTQQITGDISSTADIDYFRLTLARPASSIEVSLSGLSANYDLVLASLPESFDAGEAGLDGVAGVGGTINAIGGTINAIGGTINAIGGTINAIGGTINAIGGTINAISANGGTSAEAIETTLWLPGTYYVAVASAGEDSGDDYTLEVTVLGSALSRAEPAPEVALRGRAPSGSNDQVTTLYIMNSRRMAQPYGGAGEQSALLIKQYLDRLATLGPNPSALDDFTGNPGRREFGYVIDVAELVPTPGNTKTISDVYQLWDDNAANPFYANYVAGLVDNLVEAVREPSGISGDAPAFELGGASEPALHFPNLRYVVLAGADDSLPFFRLPDLTTIANEADYLAYVNALRQGGVIDETRALGAALRNRTILSDNPYGASRPYRFPGSPLFVPRLAVGRLVETPFDIERYLAYYASRYEPPLALQQVSVDESAFTIDFRPQAFENARAFVSGYDFLTDQGEEISRTLDLAGFGPEDCEGSPCTRAAVAPLLDDSWTDADLEQTWFNGQLSAIFSDTEGLRNPSSAEQDTKLSSLNAHFDHWQILPAVTASQEENFPAQRLLDPEYDTVECSGPSCYPGFFGQTLGYSVGCHSGYNVPQAALVAALSSPTRFTVEESDLYQSDFAQATNRHAGNWIGNTGYGYGTLDGVDYSERLSTLITEELFTRVTDPLSPTVYIGQSIGDALKHARLRYLRNASELSPYDAKVTQVMTLFGLPYIRLYGFEDHLLEPPAEQGRPGEPPPAERPAPVPTVAPSGLLERTITFDIALGDDSYEPIERTGSEVLRLAPADFAVTDSWASLTGPVRVFENNQVGVPQLPRFAYDISALNNAGSERLVVRSVEFVEGSYGAVTGFNPQITQIVSETEEPLIETGVEPSFAAGAGIWYPDKFFGFSSVGEEDDLRDQLVSAAAQFRADANGTTGLLRPYTRMVFKVIYVDPAAEEAAQTLADAQGPTIEAVRLEQVFGSSARQSPQTRVIVRLADGEGPARVQANFVQGEEWQNVVFTRASTPQHPNRYVAVLPQLVGQVRVIVRATDAAGNSSFYTARGRFAPPQQPTLYLPLLAR